MNLSVICMASVVSAALVALVSCNGNGGGGTATSLVPPAATPVVNEISGFGKWGKASATTPDTFWFSVRAEQSCAGTGATLCSLRFPDTAFIDFTIPTFTTFEVTSDGAPLSEVAEIAPMGDMQYRKTQMTDGSDGTIKWRIAVSVPGTLGTPPKPRSWCPATTFPLEIVDVSTNSAATRSAALPMKVYWGRCQSVTGGVYGMMYASTQSGTPQQTKPPTPKGDCPGNTAARSFDVCERCGTSGIGAPKTFWGCTLTEAIHDMGNFGCTSVLRNGPNC